MARVKRGCSARRRRKRLMEMAHGYYGAKSKRFKVAKETVQRALVFAYRDRKVKKREFRKLWIVRINAAANEHGVSYSALMGALKKANMTLDRRVLAELAMHEPEGFANVIKQAMAA